MFGAHSRRGFVSISASVFGAAIVGRPRPSLAQGTTPTARLKGLGIALPAPAVPTASFSPAVLVGNLLYVSGHVPAVLPDGSSMAGKVGSDLTLQQGQAAARGVGLNILATVQSTLGSLDRVVRIVKVLGMVNVAPGFTETPQVINGFSDFMVEVFGKEQALAARSAVGVAALPRNVPVEIEAIFEVRS